MERQRLDKWLWFARMARTRPLAVNLITAGYVRLGGKRIDDPSRGVKIGDVLTLALPNATIVIVVDAFAERRGPAPEARRLYSLVGPGASDDTSLASHGESV